MNWYDIFGNLAFILVALSLLAKDILWLRTLSVVSSLSAIIFNYNAAANPLWTPIRWNLFFICLNIFHISKIFLANKKISLREKEKEIYEWFFKDLSLVEFHKLISAGSFNALRPGDTIIKEGEVVDHLYLIYSGSIDILKNNTKVGSLKDGQFLGEMSFLSNEKATATAVVQYPTEVVVWNQVELKELLRKSPSLIFSLQGALGAQVSKVLEKRNNEEAKNKRDH